MEVMTGILFSAYQLIKFIGRGEGGSYQAFFYCILSLVMMLVLMIRIFTGKQKARKPENKLDYVMIVLLAVGLGSFLYKMLTVKTNIEYEAIALAIAFSYYVFSCREEFSRFFADFFLITGAAIYVLLYLFFFLGENAGWIGIPVTGGAQWSTWVTLTAVFGMLCYCKGGGDVLHSVFGMCMSLAGFFLLLLYQDVIQIYLMGLIILLIPVINWPNREILKRSMQLLFLWAIMLCNMRVFMEITGIEVRIGLYSVGCSACIEVLAVIVGILLLIIWDNMPEEKENLGNWTYNTWRIVLWMLIAYAGVLMLIITGVMQKEIPDKERWVDFAKLSQEWLGSLKENRNIFQTVYSSWGMSGLFFLVLILLLLAASMYRRYYECEDNSLLRKKVLYLMPIVPLFVLELLFTDLDVGTLPVYIWVITSILYCNAKTVAGNQPEMTEEVEYEADYSDSVL